MNGTRPMNQNLKELNKNMVISSDNSNIQKSKYNI